MNREHARARANERCWSSIGVMGGDGSCPELREHAHCRECSVITIAADQLLARMPEDPPGAEALTARHTHGERPPIDGAGMLSVITFEVGGQYLALEAARVVEVSATRPVRRVPHRTSPVFAGLVNVQGKLEPCFSLGAMLGLPPTVEPGEPRLLVVGDDVRRCAFHVYRPALQEADSGGVGAPPATLSAALESHVRGILRLGDRPWSWLDADRLLTSLERRLA